MSTYSTPSATREVLERHGLYTKYGLGQNFLVNDDVIRKIVELADVQDADCILEVGPGIGTLTAALLVLRFFQYRWRRSWAVAGIAHLISQGALSLFVANWVNYNPKMIAVHFMVMLAVLIVQIPVFWWLLDENGSETGVRYAFWSNLATGVLNSVFLIHFPL